MGSLNSVSFDQNGHKVTITIGQTNKGFAGQWYRHDKVQVDGVPLDGMIQVRRRHYGKRIGLRTERMTGFQNSCVLGEDVTWLARQNGIDLSAPPPQQHA